MQTFIKFYTLSIKMQYVIKFGHRRFLSCKNLEWKTIDAKNLLTGITSQIPIKDIMIYKNVRSRIEDDDLAELMTSIKQNGLLQPIGIHPKNKFSEKSFLITNAMENIQRKNISPTELGATCNRLHSTHHNLSLGEIAAMLSISKHRVESSIELFKRIPESFHSSISYIESKDLQNKKGKISSSVAIELSQTRTNKKTLDALFQLAKQEELSVGDVKIIITLLNQGMNLKQAMSFRNKYKSYNIKFALNLKELNQMKDKYKISSTGKIILAIIKGKIPANKKLLFKLS